MIKRYSIDLDIKQALTRSDIELVRLDSGTSVLDISLYDGSVTFAIPGDASATLVVARPDKAVTVLPATSTGTGGVQVILTDTALAVPGWALAEIVLKRISEKKILLILGFHQVNGHILSMPIFFISSPLIF